MKASKLIKQLEMVIRKHGDLEVMVTDPEDMDNELPVHSVVRCEVDDEITHYLLADKETTLAFI